MAAFKQTRSSMPDSSTKPPVRRFSTEEGEYLVQDEVFLRNDGSTDKTVTTALTFRDFLTGRTVPLRLRRIPEQRAAVTVSAEERKLDSVFMREALLLAREAFDGSEVPVGAVVVKDGKIISRGRNRVMELPDPTAHAEVLAIQTRRECFTPCGSPAARSTRRWSPATCARVRWCTRGLTG